jgi:hypothetical protein
MAKQVTFTADTDRRTVAVMRQVESTGPVTSRPQRLGQKRYHARPTLWEVTAVGGGVCTVRAVNQNDTLNEASEQTDVLYHVLAVVGNKGLLCRRADGKQTFVVGGVDWTSIPGYDAGKTQVLSHVGGVLTWQDTGVC